MLDDAVYRDLFASAPDGIVIVDDAGRIVIVNDQAEKLFGYTQAELAGRPIEVLIPARYRSVHSLRRTSYSAHPRARPMGAGLQLMARRKDLTEFPVEISLSPVATGNATLISAFVRDTTERRRNEEAIRAQAQLLDLAQDAIIVLDPQRRISYWNNGAEYTYGWTADEALGQNIDALVQTSFSGWDAPVLAALMETGAWEGELEHTTQDGRRITVASRMVLDRAADGSPTTIMEINRDITERRRLERDRELLLLESERQQDRERIGMDLHDGIIQSIYAVSLGLEGAIEDVDADPAEARRSVATAMDQLSDVIRDVRSYIFELRPSKFSSDLSESFEEMVGDFEKGAPMRVESTIERSLPPLTEEQRSMLFHIAREALTNARKHAEASCIGVVLRSTPTAVLLEVRDDGRGFDATSPTTEQQNGLRNMDARARAINAELRVTSSPGNGTSIAVTLPVGAREAATR